MHARLLKTLMSAANRTHAELAAVQDATVYMKDLVQQRSCSGWSVFKGKLHIKSMLATPSAPRPRLL